MIEMLVENENVVVGGNREAIDPIESSYFSSALAWTLRNYEGSVLGVSIVFREGEEALAHCRIRVELTDGRLDLEGQGSSRSESFMRTADHLDRKLSSLLRSGASRQSGASRLAA